MVDQIYYKVQYPLKKAVDLMKELDKKDLNNLTADLSQRDREDILNFIEAWNQDSKNKLTDLINNLRIQKQ